MWNVFYWRFIKRNPQMFLTLEWNKFSKGKKNITPALILASPTLYEAYEKSLIQLQRFVDDDYKLPEIKTLIYKTASMLKCNKLRRWQFIFIDNKTLKAVS